MLVVALLRYGQDASSHCALRWSPLESDMLKMSPLAAPTMAMMTETFANAPVKYDEYIPAPNGMVSVFSITRPSGPVLFEVNFPFVTKTDFWVVISNFGTKAPGSITTKVMQEFDADELESAKVRITEYFSDPERRVPYPVGLWPLNDTRGRYLGVQFPDGWAVEKQ